MDALTPCPGWLVPESQMLLRSMQARRVHHAPLICGVDGIGKQAFAQWLAEALLCSNRTDQGACGECASCRQLLADAHPDFRTVAPEGTSTVVKIDAVRELVDWMHLTASQDSYRVAMIDQANALNQSSANALLKTLEEPADNAVLILCAQRPAALPATVRSRCQTITLKMSDQDAAIAWLATVCDKPEEALAAAGGAPFRALRELGEENHADKVLLLKAWSDLLLHRGSVGRIADSLSKLDASICLSEFSKWCVLAVKRLENVPSGADSAVSSVLEDTHDRLQNEQWLTLHERILELHRVQSSSFKTQTVLEGLFADIRLMING